MIQRTNSNYINASDYLMKDKEEDELLKKYDEAEDGYKKDDYEQQLINLQVENRGIGEKSIDSIVFGEYLLRRIRIFCVGSSTYYAYNRKAHCYMELSKRTIRKIIRLVCDEYDEALYKPSIASCVESVLFDIVEEVDELLPSHGVIVFKNGTLYTNLDSDEPMRFEKKFSAKNIVFSTLPYSYDENKKCPRFEQFLDECMRGDEQLKQLLLDCLSNIFAFGDVYIHHFCILYGVGRNGKSVLLECLSNYVFPNLCSHIHLSKLNDRFGLAALVDKVMNISSESETTIVNTEIIKEVSAGSTTSAEFKYKDSFSVRITAKLFVATNQLPIVKDYSRGWSDRLTVIPFEQIFEIPTADGEMEEDVYYQNPYLIDELGEEAEGIAIMLLRNLEDLKARQWVLSYSERAEEVKQRILMESRPVELFFNSCIEIYDADSKMRIKTSDIHKAFKEWCNHNEINTYGFADSKSFHKEFRRILELNGQESKPKEYKGYQNYVDIGLTENYKSQVIYSYQ